nr:thrombospondin type-1 domain-containing protein 4 [Nerophis lumbriciformis]
MAGLWQHLCSLQLIPALALFQFLCLLQPTSSVGGRNTGAELGFKLVKGNFSRMFLRVGYHKIAEIPSGAFNISIRETKKSRNYLALQTSSGKHIINGHWVIDRPGIYNAVGTQLTYQRPNEVSSRAGESITVPGPLTDDLHVYLIYQQPSPSVHFEYVLPLTNTKTTPEPSSLSTLTPYVTSDEMQVVVGMATNDIVKEKPSPNMVPGKANVNPQPVYTWTKRGYTECSSTCGKGRRQLLWECIDKALHVSVPADLCDPTLEPSNQQEDCHIQQCPAYWDVGEWSECSKKCGPGSQHRQVICRQVTHVHSNGTETSVTAAPELCGSADKPVTKSSCQLKICSQWEIRSEWSECSVPCGVGQRSRQVVCVSNQDEVEPDEECNMNLKPDRLQNCDMGACARSWFTSQWNQKCSAECGQGNRTRTTVCLMNHVTDLPLDSCNGERPKEVTTCNSGPCQNRLEWYAGPWSQCSAECGNGTQTRNLACVLQNKGHMEVVVPMKCSTRPKPITAQPCVLKPCGVQWYVTEWSMCSRSCNGGYRVREVRCLTDNVAPSEQCDPTLIPESREECNTQPCGADIKPACSDQYHNCMLVVQARLCVYAYYTSVCCASCRRWL